MSKPRTPPLQYEKTQSLLAEIGTRSGISWKNLYVVLEQGCPGLVSGESNMRQLANGHRFLNDEKLATLAKWAISKGWGGDVARAAIAFVAPTAESLLKAVQAKRREQYLKGDPVSRIIKNPMRLAEQEKRRSVAALDAALAKMSPAGFSHADILYMAYSWLIKNPPTNKRGTRQPNIVLSDDVQGRGLEAPVFPESLPGNFSLPEHRDGIPWKIECRVSTPWEGFKGISPDRIDEA